MNSQKKLIATIFAFILLNHTSCKTQIQERSVNSISMGIEVQTGYVFSPEAEIKLNNKIYSLRHKAEYDYKGNIVKLTIYKPEGKLEYDKHDLLKDSGLLQYINLPISQHLRYSSLQGLFDENKMVPARVINDSVLISTEGTSKMFYSLN